MRVEQLADGVYWKRLLIVNMMFIGEPGAEEEKWAVVDTGLALSADAIERTARDQLGYKGRPSAIVLTHGHFDHVGALKELVRRWNVPVYAHEEEIPFVTGQQDYLPPDPQVGGGMMAWISPVYPKEAIDLGAAVHPLPQDGSVPGLPDWRWLHTPGHTPGHVSLFREVDRTLIAGDAFITVKQESAWSVLTQQKAIHGPPAYFTPDWKAAKRSVEKLAALHPEAAVTGHGLPVYGQECRSMLTQLAAHFESLAVPERGRYV